MGGFVAGVVITIALAAIILVIIGWKWYIIGYNLRLAKDIELAHSDCVRSVYNIIWGDCMCLRCQKCLWGLYYVSAPQTPRAQHKTSKCAVSMSLVSIIPKWYISIYVHLSVLFTIVHFIEVFYLHSQSYKSTKNCAIKIASLCVPSTARRKSAIGEDGVTGLRNQTFEESSKM